MSGASRSSASRTSPPSVLTAGPGDLGPLVERVLAHSAGERRVLLGVAGAPGAGKSTLTEALALALTGAGVNCAVVGMDGFHLAQAELERLGRADRKGAPDTFDADGYLALLRRLRAQQEHAPTIYAPLYLRGEVEQPIGSAVPVEATVQVVLTEGNYLLLPQAAWAPIRQVLAETWFVRVDEAARRERLLARHLANGKSMDRALEFTDGSDALNAALIAPTAQRADLIVDWAEAG